jgi:Flp pilus assembly pilin Flp
MLKLFKNKKGQGLVEYAFIVAGVAFICLLALSVFGHKLSDQYAIMGGMLPGAHQGDNAPVASMAFLSTGTDAEGNQTGTGQVSWNQITGNAGTGGVGGLQNNVITQGASDGDAFVGE